MRRENNNLKRQNVLLRLEAKELAARSQQQQRLHQSRPTPTATSPGGIAPSGKGDGTYGGRGAHESDGGNHGHRGDGPRELMEEAHSPPPRSAMSNSGSKNPTQTVRPVTCRMLRSNFITMRKHFLFFSYIDAAREILSTSRWPYHPPGQMLGSNVYSHERGCIQNLVARRSKISLAAGEAPGDNRPIATFWLEPHHGNACLWIGGGV